jgi:hypothetical protein
MFAPLVIAAALGSMAGAADVPAPPDGELVLEIRAKAIYPDDKSFARAGDSGAVTVASYIYIVPNGCGLGASTNEPTQPLSGGWHVTGRVLQRTGDSLLARIEWQRLWEQSQRLPASEPRSMEVWIHSGDSLPLDEIASSPTEKCKALGARLEATVTDQLIGPPRAHMSGTGVGGARAGGTGSGGGAGSGGGTGAGGARAGATGGGGTGNGGGTSANMSVGSGGASTGPGFGPGVASTIPLDLDVWLVHTRADGGETTQHQRVSGGQSQFTFQAITIGTARGEASVQVQGGVQAVVDVSGERQLRVSVQRQVTGAASSRGTSLSAYQLPGPDDVYAIELPPLNVKGEMLKADRVSIRVRLAK